MRPETREKLERELAKGLGYESSKTLSLAAGVYMSGVYDYINEHPEVKLRIKNRHYWIRKAINDAIHSSERPTTAQEVRKVAGVSQAAVTTFFSHNPELKELVYDRYRADELAFHLSRYKGFRKLVDGGKSINQACKSMGLAINAYYRSLHWLEDNHPELVSETSLRRSQAVKHEACKAPASTIYNRLLMGRLTGQSSAAG